MTPVITHRFKNMIYIIPYREYWKLFLGTKNFFPIHHQMLQMKSVQQSQFKSSINSIDLNDQGEKNKVEK